MFMSWLTLRVKKTDEVVRHCTVNFFFPLLNSVINLNAVLCLTLTTFIWGFYA